MDTQSRFLNAHPQKLDHEIYVDGPFMKIGLLANFRLYSIAIILTLV